MSEPTAPVVFRILQSIQAAVQGISTAGSYFYDVDPSSVVLDPVSLAAVMPGQLPFVVCGDVIPGERVFASSRPVQIKDVFSVTLMWRVDADSTDAEARYRAGWNFVADLERALLTDPQRGALALYTYVQQSTVYVGEAGQAMVFGSTPAEVRLNRVYGQP